MAWVSASMPVAAVTWRGRPVINDGIERRHRRHEARVGDHQLPVGFRVRDDRGHGHLGPGARRGRHRVDRHRRAQALEVPDQLARMLPVGDGQRDRLRRVHRRAAAERHDGVAAVLLVERDALFDQRNRRVRRDRIEDDVRGAALGQRLGQAVQQPHLAQWCGRSRSGSSGGRSRRAPAPAVGSPPGRPAASAAESATAPSRRPPPSSPSTARRSAPRHPRCSASRSSSLPRSELR